MENTTKAMPKYMKICINLMIVRMGACVFLKYRSHEFSSPCSIFTWLTMNFLLFGSAHGAIGITILRIPTI